MMVRTISCLLLVWFVGISSLMAEEPTSDSSSAAAVSMTESGSLVHDEEGFDEQSDEVTVLKEMDRVLDAELREQAFIPPASWTNSLENGQPVTRDDAIGLVAAQQRHSLVERQRPSPLHASRVDWERLQYLNQKTDLDIPYVNNVQVLRWIEFFSGRAKRWFRRYLERSSYYLPYIRKVFNERGLPQDLAYVAMIESGFTTEAKSWAGALGLWQFMSYTARPFGLRSDPWVEERINWRKATHAAANYLEYCYANLNNWPLAIAAYNAGHGKMYNAIKKYGSRDFWEISQYSYLARESRLYVPKLIAAAIIAKNPIRYGFMDLNYQAPEDVDLVMVPDPTDLASLARCARTDEDTLRRLNPELRRGVTPPDAGKKGYEIALPLGLGDRFRENYAKLDHDKTKKALLTYVIKPGDFPGKIAEKFAVKVSDLLAFNNIKNTRGLRVGRELIIPTLGQGLGSFSGETLPGMTTGHHGLVLEKKPGPKGAVRREHRVRFGDSVARIARQYKVSSSEVIAWNGLREKQRLIPGKILLVYTDAPKSDEELQKEQESFDPDKVKVRDVVFGEPDRKGNKGRVHIVTPGDTLWKVATKYGVSIQQIKSWNNLRGNALSIGQKLRIGR